MKFKKVLTNTDFDLGLRIRFVWTLKVSIMNKLEAFQMWVYRRVL